MSARPRGLARRIYLAFLIAAVVPTAVAGVLGVYFSLQTLRMETLNNLDQEVTIRAQGASRFLGQLAAELRYLAASPTLDRLRASIVPGGSAMAMARNDIEREYANLAGIYPHIYQVRFLSEDGLERVRVDRTAVGARVVPAGELQDKSDRYYVQEAMSLPPGAIFVSPLDLNIEFGRIEQPERPVIRMAIRIGGDGVPGGMLIVNLHADILLEQIQQMVDARDGVAILFDRAGYYLSQSRRAVDEGEGFAMRRVAALAPTFGSRAVERVLAGDRVVEGDGWIIAARPVVLPEISPGPVGEGRWVLALAFPEQALFAQVFNLYVLYAILLCALLVTAGAGFLLTRRIIGPLEALSRESEALAAGDFSRRVSIPGDDEIAALGARFNDMAARLQALYASIEGQRDRLEIEVNRRTADLDRERSFLARLFEQIGDAVMVVDRQGSIRLSNPQAQRLFDLDPKGDRRLDAHWPEWPALATELEHVGALRRDVDRDGRVLSISVSRHGDGDVMVARDVTDERQLADQRRELDRQMFQMEKMVTLGELAMGLAHEVGNPLAGMKAVAQAMQYEDDVPPGLMAALRRMEREIDRLASFLKTFHGYAAPQPLCIKPCALDEVLDDVLFWTRKEARQKGVEIDVDLAADLPPLQADASALKQVLLNLLVNALHATPAGGWIRVGACAESGNVALEVADSGCGIPAAVLPRVFEPFFTTRNQGSGLGLTIVRKIVLQHGAQIAVTSTEGAGTCFALKWPSSVRASR